MLAGYRGSRSRISAVRRLGNCSRCLASISRCRDSGLGELAGGVSSAATGWLARVICARLVGQRVAFLRSTRLDGVELGIERVFQARR